MPQARRQHFDLSAKPVLQCALAATCYRFMCVRQKYSFAGLRVWAKKLINIKLIRHSWIELKWTWTGRSSFWCLFFTHIFPATSSPIHLFIVVYARARERKKNLPTKCGRRVKNCVAFNLFQSSCCVVRKKLRNISVSVRASIVSEMSSKNVFNVFRVLVLAIALVDILLNIYSLFSAYMEKRDGTYNRYLWQWNAFYVARIATSALVLYGVIKSSLRLLIVAAVLNGLIFAALLYAVAVAKFAYNNCERNLCRFTDNCETCYSKNYNDYDFTKTWSSKFDFSLEKYVFL